VQGFAHTWRYDFLYCPEAISSVAESRQEGFEQPKMNLELVIFTGAIGNGELRRDPRVNGLLDINRKILKRLMSLTPGWREGQFSADLDLRWQLFQAMNRRPLWNSNCFLQQAGVGNWIEIRGPGEDEDDGA
jgi:hypothetical protein